MKKEHFAVLLLGAIVLLTPWNLRHLDRLTEPLLCLTEEAYAQAGSGQADLAAGTAQQAEELWLRANRYTHIFLRHPEVDAVSDAFCAFRGAIAGGDPGVLLGSYLSLRMRLSGLREMEQLRLGCIF